MPHYLETLKYRLLKNMIEVHFGEDEGHFIHERIKIKMSELGRAEVKGEEGR